MLGFPPLLYFLKNRFREVHSVHVSQFFVARFLNTFEVDERGIDLTYRATALEDVTTVFQDVDDLGDSEPRDKGLR